MEKAHKASMVRMVLDTSVFTNPDTARQFGEDPATAFATFVTLAEGATGRAQFFMPPSIYSELQTFFGTTPPPPQFELQVALQAPNRYALQVPGFLLYELIDDIRTRIDRGLRVAERAVRDAHPENVDQSINRLRTKYRDALRAGLLDSREDVDLILLALELDAALVSSDHGVVQWAERMGVRIIHPEQLRAILDDLIAASPAS